MMLYSLSRGVILSALVASSLTSFAETSTDSKSDSAKPQVAKPEAAKPAAAPKKSAASKRAKKPAKKPSVEEFAPVAPQPEVDAVKTPESDAPIAEKKMILQNGNPQGGAIDVTPYIGSYALIGFEAGVMGGYRILPNGFIPMINNSIAIEGGLHRARWSLLGIGENRFAMTADGRWEFHVHPMWSPYAAVGLGFERHWYDGDDSASNDVKPNIKVGAFLHFNQNIGMRFEFSETMASHRIGAVFSF